jgi:hypothetical protein
VCVCVNVCVWGGGGGYGIVYVQGRSQDPPRPMCLGQGADLCVPRAGTMLHATALTRSSRVAGRGLSCVESVYQPYLAGVRATGGVRVPGRI